MKGGFRPGSGRKKGSIPWNKNIPMRKETKEKQRLAHLGKIAWNKDKEMSDSMRDKMKGNKNGSGNKGRTYKPETLEKMSIAKIGIPSPMKGKKHSQITRDKIRDAKRKFLKKENSNYIPMEFDERGKRIIRNGGFHSKGEWETLKAQYNWTCPSCKETEPFLNQKYKHLTKDHIIAISMGGSDNIENIQPLCHRCNSRKQAKEIRY